MERRTPGSVPRAAINIEGIEVFAPHRRESVLAGSTLLLVLSALILIGLGFRSTGTPPFPRTDGLDPHLCVASDACAALRPDVLDRLPSVEKLFAWRFTCRVFEEGGRPLPQGCVPGAATFVTPTPAELRDYGAHADHLIELAQERYWATLPDVPPHSRSARSADLDHRQIATAAALQAQVAFEAALLELWDVTLQRASHAWRLHDTARARRTGQRWIWLSAAALAALLSAGFGAAWVIAHRGVRLGISAHRVQVGRHQIPLYRIASVDWLPDRVAVHLDDGEIFHSPPVHLSVHARVVLTDAMARVLEVRGIPDDTDEENRVAIEALRST